MKSVDAPVVVTGSSLAVTLDFAESNHCVYNLGLIGESALTGLDVISESAYRPRVVFVEVNFPGRDSNRVLINEATGFVARNFPDFVYTPPITLLGESLGRIYHSFKDRSLPKSTVMAVQDPDIARQNELSIQQENFKTPLPSLLLATKIAEFRSRIARLEQQGLKVILFEMPVLPLLQNSNQATQVRNAFKDAFPDHKFIGFDELSKGVIVKPADGLHLNAESAKGVIENMKVHYVEDCK